LTSKYRWGHVSHRGRRGIFCTCVPLAGTYSGPRMCAPRHMTVILNRPTRRRLLKAAAAAGLGFVGAPFVLRAAGAQTWTAGDPFSLGVASGAPRPDGFVLWSRLAPEPLSPNPQPPGGMHGRDVPLGSEIPTHPALRDVARHGEATAEQAFAYSVHLDVRGLQPGRPYWYRFTSGDASSRIGR